ncbi:MAG TPA: poly-gamma-glutamate synthase PgsB [Firmicutes bacterium]|nr:poly-gamma-glutamate synthase PgsB [Bacillota bacterium]
MNSTYSLSAAIERGGSRWKGHQGEAETTLPLDPFILMTLALVGAGIYEKAGLDRAVGRIPIRIHVNGTRGKSSVTRLIAAALRGGGLRVLAKTTGSAARLVLPDGAEVALNRRGGASILEYVPVLREAARQRVDAVVIECMAVRPEYQRFTEREILRATIAVITNARCDHMDEMGETEEDVARALCSVIPGEGAVFTAEDLHLEIIRREAKRRGSRVVTLNEAGFPPGDCGEVAEIASRLSYLEFEENIGLALAVARYCGVEPDAARSGILGVTPDPGALKIWKARWPGDSLTYFVNAFAANDVDSARRVVARVTTILPLASASSRIVGILNCRADRPDRTRQWADALIKGHFPVDVVIATGSGCYPLRAFRPAIRQRGVDFRLLGAVSPDRVMQEIGTVVTEGGIVLGLGNIAGAGMALAKMWAGMGEEEWKPGSGSASLPASL